MEATVRLEHELVAVDAEHDVHVLLEVSAPARLDAARPPLRLALVLDRSGSMGGGALETVKRAAGFVLGQLGDADSAAVVVYDDVVETIAPLGAPPAVAVERLRHVGVGGSTNLSGGWLEGRSQLAEADGARRVVLLTDGLANQGITDPATLTGIVGEAARDGIGTTCMGVGDAYDEELLAAMAQAAGGEYHFLASADDAPKAFAAELGDLVALVAQNVTLDIRPSASVELVAVLNDLPSAAVDGGVRVTLGDGYAGQRRRVVLQLHVPRLAELGPAKVADLVLRYVAVEGGVSQHVTTIPVLVNVVTSDDAAASVPDAQVVDEVTVLYAASAGEQARQLADAGRLDEAERLLADAEQRLRTRADRPDAPEEIKALTAQWGDVRDTVRSYSPENRKRLHAMTHMTRTRKTATRSGHRLVPPPWRGDRDALGLVADDGVDLADKYRGALVGGAIGDALGRPAEGLPVEEVARRFGELREFLPWRGWTSGPVGTITDDTQLTMCVAEALLAHGGIDPDDLARRLVAWLPVGRGKGRACLEAIQRLAAGVPWDAAGAPSAGNGAAMRAAPVGLLRAGDIEGLRRDAALSALVTHVDEMAVLSAVAQAAAVAWLVHRRPGTLDPAEFLRAVALVLDAVPDPALAERRPGGDLVRLGDRLQQLGGMLELDVRAAFDRLWNGAFVLESLPAAWWCFLRWPDDPERVLVTAANQGRDADTVAAMAGTLAGAYLGESALPHRWRDPANLEYADELIVLADALLAARQRQPGPP